MSNRHRRLAAALCGLTLALPALAAEAPAADDPHAACRAKAAAAAAEAAKPEAAPAGASVTLEDLALVDQHGVSRRFASEVIADRVVVMDFIFTTCTTICPLLSSKMVRLQEKLGDRLGKDVFLVSVSVDPLRDTPQKLLAYAGKWKARPGWTFLTGPKADVDAVLKGVGAYTANFTDHPPMFLVGDGKAGRWTRLNGFPDADRILQQVDELVAARTRTASLGGQP
ncbi:MAG TPA: SCO family protein [Anaeromyxobacter sp.]|nr:SCO family protein [Anaeromyxobacter sp.]